MSSPLRLDWCSHAAAVYACEHWHYSRCIPKSKLVKIGVWEGGEFKGAVIFGVGANNALVRRFGLEPQEGCELVRVALRSHDAPVSRILAISLRMLRSFCPGLRLIVSFADPEQGHVGAIYQATGWIYSGTTGSSNEYILHGKRWHGRSFRNGHKGMENHPAVQKVKGSSKHRYLMPLDPAIRLRVEGLAKPYPKNPPCVQGAESGAPATRRRGRINST